MKRVILGIVAIWLVIGAGAAVAHPALYHYLEINLHEPGTVRIFVTLHAPELSDTVAPLEEDVFGADWLASRSDEVIADLVANGHQFAADRFDFAIGDRILKLDLTFPGAVEIRHPSTDSEVPAGCFSGDGELVYYSGEEKIALSFSENAEKRLMLVINRPAAFPEVFDIEPGSRKVIALPPARNLNEQSVDEEAVLAVSENQNQAEATLSPRTTVSSFIPYLIALFAVVGIAFWWYRRR